METLESAPSSGAASFASFLAGLAAPETSPDEWNTNGLADDVTAISYEQALRRQSPEGTLTAVATRAEQSQMRSQAAELLAVKKAKGSLASTQNRADGRKSASITIRLSQAECAQLHERAAAAGLSISAYLRSCTLEVETLRTQVKEALAHFNAVAAAAERKEPEKPVASFQTWRSRLFPRRAAQA